MKRVLALLLVFALAFCFCACSGDKNDGNDSGDVQETEQITEEVTEETTKPSDEEPEPSYSVTVVDEEGNPVVGAWVQLCLEACVPAVTDENGVANFFLEEDDYKVGFTVMPEGYDYVDEEQQWYFADGETTMTIVIKKVA